MSSDQWSWVEKGITSLVTLRGAHCRKARGAATICDVVRDERTVMRLECFLLNFGEAIRRGLGVVVVMTPNRQWKTAP